MSHSILNKNKNIRCEFSLSRLVLFAMFCFWQMGFIYFIGPSLTINGRTPLPISMDNVSTLIVFCYVLSILYMILLPQYVIGAQRLLTVFALICVLALFLPLSDSTLRIFIYLQVFCCCTMIGFETFVIVNYLTEHSAICILTAGYGVALCLIAIVQNDFLPITFPCFRLITVFALSGLLLFFFFLPAHPRFCPEYVKRDTGLTAPIQLMVGTYFLVFAGSMLAVSGPSVVSGVKHGVSLSYCVNAISSFVIYLLYKQVRFHPFKAISFCIGIGAIGFLLMFSSSFIPWTSYIACSFIGIGMVSCQMLPLYGLSIMNIYPSKYISPIIISLALLAVGIQSTLVELFRSIPFMLTLAYALIMVIFAVVYLQIAPHFMYVLDQKTATAKKHAIKSTPTRTNTLFFTLTKREQEVANLIASGYNNAEIADSLSISIYTVNDHTKNIYRKLNVHSRLEVAALLNQKL